MSVSGRKSGHSPQQICHQDAVARTEPYSIPSTSKTETACSIFAFLLEVASAARGRDQLFVGLRDYIRSLKASSEASNECEARYLGANRLKLPLMRPAVPAELITTV